MKGPAHIVTIMPDYGFGPYAWQKPATDESSLIGECIGTAVDGFETEDGTRITADLESAFAAWSEQFELHAEKKDFDWPAFHRQGLELGKRLRRELGANYRVAYHKPCEDPEHGVNGETEVDGAPASDIRSAFILAKPAQVFAAMRDPARIARWWGPDGFSNSIHQFDFHPGGTWRLTMHGPDGKDYANESRFIRIVPDQLFEIEHLSGHHFFLTIELQAVEQGTQVHWLQTFDTAEHYQAIAEFVAAANAQNLQRLAAEVLRFT